MLRRTQSPATPPPGNPTSLPMPWPGHSQARASVPEHHSRSARSTTSKAQAGRPESPGPDPRNTQSLCSFSEYPIIPIINQGCRFCKASVTKSGGTESFLRESAVSDRFSAFDQSCYSRPIVRASRRSSDRLGPSRGNCPAGFARGGKEADEAAGVVAEDAVDTGRGEVGGEAVGGRIIDRVDEHGDILCLAGRRACRGEGRAVTVRVNRRRCWRRGPGPTGGRRTPRPPRGRSVRGDRAGLRRARPWPGSGWRGCRTHRATSA